MLNPKLYAALEAAFGTTLIANEGEERLVEYTVDMSRPGRHLARTFRGGEEYRVSCPFCNDTRQRLYVNHSYGVYDPKTRSHNYYLVHCFNEDCLGDSDNRTELTCRLQLDGTAGVRLCPRTVDRAAPLQQARAPGLLTPLHRLPPDHHACAYLKARGFDPAQLSERLGVSYCGVTSPVLGTLATNRIYVPFHQDGVLIGWQARFIGERDWSVSNIPKYFTMPGMRKSQHLYNLDVARAYPFVAVVEGVTDVWAVGPPAVALLGKTASPHQHDLLRRYWAAGTVCVLLDADAGAEADRLCRELAGAVRRVVPMRLPAGADPGSFDRGFLAARLAAVVAPDASGP